MSLNGLEWFFLEYFFPLTYGFIYRNSWSISSIALMVLRTFCPWSPIHNGLVLFIFFSGNLFHQVFKKYTWKKYINTPILFSTTVPFVIMPPSPTLPLLYLLFSFFFLIFPFTFSFPPLFLCPWLGMRLWQIIPTSTNIECTCVCVCMCVF